MNVVDHLKALSVEDIKNYCELNSLPAAAAMLHISGDFNFGSLVRGANFYAFKEVYYVGGKKHYDKRSTVGTHNYTPVLFAREEADFLDMIRDKYTLVCIENNIPKFADKTVSLFDDSVFDGIENPIFLFGEEQQGISDSFLELAERIITIPTFGSVRSLNVSSCASTVFAFYRKHYENKTI
jgi:tRNA G18 (ribose-2'-O)-methylase SpoU